MIGNGTVWPPIGEGYGPVEKQAERTDAEEGGINNKELEIK